jgi:GNAT superfamily N-acetyltransferase
VNASKDNLTPLQTNVNSLTESKQAFSCETLVENDIPECIRLAVNNFEEFKTHPSRIEQWFEQRIIGNPWQKALPGIGLGIKHEGRLIAFRAMFAQPWWLNGQSMIIAFGANTAVDQPYRGKGLATQLIDNSSKLASITGTTSAGFISQKACKKLGYLEVGGSNNDFFKFRVSFQGSISKRFGKAAGQQLGRLLNVSLQLRDAKLKAQPGFYLKETFHCDAQFDQCWEVAKQGYSACLERSSAYLNWRLFDAPTCPLQLSALYDASSTLRGYAIWHVQQFSDSVGMAVLRDIFYPQQDETCLHSLLALLLSNWRNQGISWASLEVASPQLTALFKTLKYDPLPSHGNRYHIHSKLPLSADTLNNWFRSGLDGDYFDHAL